MTTPMSDDDARYFEAFMLGTGPFFGAHFGDDPPVGARGAFWWRRHFQAYATRLAKAEAERDAVAAKLAERDDALKTGTAIMFSERSRQAVEAAKRELIAEGERRATAAIVAWLRKTNGIASNGVVRTAAAIACAIERGDHLTKAKPPLPSSATPTQPITPHSQRKNRSRPMNDLITDLRAKVGRMNRAPLSSSLCPCGHKSCNRQQLNIAHDYAGSGLNPEDAEALIALRNNTLPIIDSLQAEIAKLKAVEAVAASHALDAALAAQEQEHNND